jgi:phospholipase C
LARLSPDTRPDPTRPEGVDTMPQVEHIIIYMQENHSYDNYFGMLGRGDGFTLDATGAPTNFNLDVNGNPVPVHKATAPNEAPHCSQNWNDTHDSVNGGAMDGFGRISPDALKYYDGSFLPFYYGLANTFPICDRWFTSCQGQTHPNRRYLQAGLRL